MLAIPIVYLLGEQVFNLWVLNQALKKNTRISITFDVGDITRIPGLDTQEIFRQSDVMHALGFVYIGDIISNVQDGEGGGNAAQNQDDLKEPQLIAKGVARYFAHPEHGCYAKLHYVLSRTTYPRSYGKPQETKTLPYGIYIKSLTGIDADSWTFSTTTSEKSKYDFLSSHPRRLGRIIVGASAAELLESHLKERSEIVRRTGMEWDTEISLDRILESESHLLSYARSMNQRFNAFTAALALYRDQRNKSTLYLGELEQAGAREK